MALLPVHCSRVPDVCRAQFAVGQWVGVELDEPGTVALCLPCMWVALWCLRSPHPTHLPMDAVPYSVLTYLAKRIFCLVRARLIHAAPADLHTHATTTTTTTRRAAGKNDGAVAGERYFTCEPKHGKDNCRLALAQLPAA